MFFSNFVSGYWWGQGINKSCFCAGIEGTERLWTTNEAKGLCLGFWCSVNSCRTIAFCGKYKHLYEYAYFISNASWTFYDFSTIWNSLYMICTSKCNSLDMICTSKCSSLYMICPSKCVVKKTVSIFTVSIYFLQRTKIISDLLISVSKAERQEARMKVRQDSLRLGNVGVIRYSKIFYHKHTIMYLFATPDNKFAQHWGWKEWFFWKEYNKGVWMTDCLEKTRVSVLGSVWNLLLVQLYFIESRWRVSTSITVGIFAFGPLVTIYQ